MDLTCNDVHEDPRSGQLAICSALRFIGVCMQGFDPEEDLLRIGLANQTTMLRDETLTIGKMLEKAMMQKYGPADLKSHYMVLDTICDATQACQPPPIMPQ